MILDHPNHFGRVPIVLEGSNTFWAGPNHFGQEQIVKISPEKSNLNPTKIIWTKQKRLAPDQNSLYLSKTIYLDGPKSFWTYRRTRHEILKPRLKKAHLTLDFFVK